MPCSSPNSDSSTLPSLSLSVIPSLFRSCLVNPAGSASDDGNVPDASKTNRNAVVVVAVGIIGGDPIIFSSVPCRC
jgi:hypothetical protein